VTRHSGAWKEMRTPNLRLMFDLTKFRVYCIMLLYIWCGRVQCQYEEPGLK
jgi:hypothetical protein